MKTLLGYSLAAYAALMLIIVIAAIQCPSSIPLKPHSNAFNKPTQAQKPVHSSSSTAKEAKIVAGKKTYPLPPNFSEISDVKQKKSAFFDYFHPIIADQNNKLNKHRMILLNIENNFLENKQLNKTEEHQLSGLKLRYFIDAETTPITAIKELKLRINTIPASLVLAQAANESAWGTSRFAKKANNYFGQWCFQLGCGLVPNKRSAGTKHEVRVFKSPADSVISYFNNLNSHIAYQYLREIRAQADAEGKAITGVLLAQGLVKYSERGEEYVKEIQQMIRFNKLEERY